MNLIIWIFLTLIGIFFIRKIIISQRKKPDGATNYMIIFIIIVLIIALGCDLGIIS